MYHKTESDLSLLTFYIIKNINLADGPPLSLFLLTFCNFFRARQDLWVFSNCFVMSVTSSDICYKDWKPMLKSLCFKPLLFSGKMVHHFKHDAACSGSFKTRSNLCILQLGVHALFRLDI